MLVSCRPWTIYRYSDFVGQCDLSSLQLPVSSVRFGLILTWGNLPWWLFLDLSNFLSARSNSHRNGCLINLMDRENRDNWFYFGGDLGYSAWIDDCFFAVTNRHRDLNPSLPRMFAGSRIQFDLKLKWQEWFLWRKQHVRELFSAGRGLCSASAS